MRPDKKDELVEKALEIFYKNGFNSTGMDKLAKETGVSKPSIYNHFGTKNELILAVLKLRDERFRNWLMVRMDELGTTAESKIIAMFDALDEWFNDPGFKGCMFIKASSEFQEPDTDVFKICQEHKMLIRGSLIRLAEEARLNNIDDTVNKLMLLKEGAIVSAQLGNSNSAKNAKDVALMLMP